MRVHPGGTSLLDPTANMAGNALHITLHTHTHLQPMPTGYRSLSMAHSHEDKRKTDADVAALLPVRERAFA
jgi:hypothetical protein